MVLGAEWTSTEVLSDGDSIMSKTVNSYNPDVLATKCRRCEAEYPNRCKGTGAHRIRIKDAGYRWNVQLKRLDKIL